MKSKLFDIGTRFHQLALLEFRPSCNGRRIASFRCDCGVIKDINLQNVYRGLVLSCGCHRRRINSLVHRTHGHAGNAHKSRTTEYRIWSLMIQRCENRKNPAYDRYGGRGIMVCERWHRFEDFYADMGPRIPKHSIDRVNNDGNYEPGNCRWATALQQRHNRRDSVKCEMRPLHPLQ
jgi:hypothetical protein